MFKGRQIGQVLGSRMAFQRHWDGGVVRVAAMVWKGALRDQRMADVVAAMRSRRALVAVPLGMVPLGV